MLSSVGGVRGEVPARLNFQENESINYFPVCLGCSFVEPFAMRATLRLFTDSVTPKRVVAYIGAGNLFRPRARRDFPEQLVGRSDKRKHMRIIYYNTFIANQANQ